MNSYSKLNKYIENFIKEKEWNQYNIYKKY